MLAKMSLSPRLVVAGEILKINCLTWVARIMTQDNTGLLETRRKIGKSYSELGKVLVSLVRHGETNWA